MKKKLSSFAFFVGLVLLLFTLPALAHEATEAEGNVLLDSFFQIWIFHDAVHWMIAIPFMATCYYYRHVAGRLLGHPFKCGCAEKAGKEYGEEFVMKKFHRYFFWLMLIFIFIHMAEAIAETTGMIEYNFRLFNPYIYPFTSEAMGPQSAAVQAFGNLVEWLYVLMLLVFLFSCHYLRHFVGGSNFDYSGSFWKRVKGKLYRTQIKLNEYHGLLFWLSVASMILLLAAGGHL